MNYDVGHLYAVYLQEGSLHRAAPIGGMTGETLRKLLARNGMPLLRSKWKSCEIDAIRAAYAAKDGVDLHSLSNSLGRTRAAIACKAEMLGLTYDRGKHVRTPSSIANMSKAQKILATKPGIIEARTKRVSEAFKRNGHPKGMLGKQHKQSSKDAISAFHSGKKLPRCTVLKMMKSKIARFGTLAPNVKRGNWKSCWCEIDGVRFFARSKWEANYAHFLQWLKSKGEITSWRHEPKTFWFEGIKRGVVSYLPDFEVIKPDGSIEYHEVKGWMDGKSKTKIKRMKKYHPSVKLDVVDSKRYKALEKQMKNIVPGWQP